MATSYHWAQRKKSEMAWVDPRAKTQKREAFCCVRARKSFKNTTRSDCYQSMTEPAYDHKYVLQIPDVSTKHRVAKFHPHAVHALDWIDILVLIRSPDIIVGGLRFYRDSSFFFFRQLPSELTKPPTCSEVSAIWKCMSEIRDIPSPYKSGAH